MAATTVNVRRPHSRSSRRGPYTATLEFNARPGVVRDRLAAQLCDCAVLVERAVAHWWSERGVSFSGGRPTTPDAFTVVREYAITFHRPVRGIGAVGVHFWLERMGTTSADYRFRVTSPDGGSVFAEGRRVTVRLDPATMRPVPWTDHGRALGAALLRDQAGS